MCKIIPRTGKLLIDKTTIINVKFRLAGETWPPFLLYKIVIEGLTDFKFSKMQKINKDNKIKINQSFDA